MFRSVLAVTMVVAALILVVPATYAQTTYTTNVGGTIVDDDPVGVSSIISVGDSFNLDQVTSVTITGFQHTFISDLLVTLTHNGTTVEIFDAVGGASNLDGDYTFMPSSGLDINVAGNQGDDDIIDPVPTYNTRTAGDGGEGPTEYSTINGSLSDFHGQNVNGDWTLNISDHVGGDSGSFTGWSFTVTSNIVVLPEPSSLALLLPFAVGLIARRRLR